MPQRQISPERKTIYYLGMGLLVLGFLSFGSTFVSAVANFGSFHNFESRTQSMMVRALLGVGLMVGGGFLMSVGRAGLAGSGIKLEPEEARKDVEPWARMTGGVVKDA